MGFSPKPMGAKICKDQGSFIADATFGAGTPCVSAANLVEEFAPNATTCAAEIEIFGIRGNRTFFLEQVGACCGGTARVCPPASSPTPSPTPSPTLVSESPGPPSADDGLTMGYGLSLLIAAT